MIRRVGRSAALRALGVGAVAATALVLVSAHVPDHNGGRSLDLLGYLLLVLSGLAIGGSWRWPRVSVLVTVVVLCAFVARDYPNGPVWLAGPVVLAVLSWRTSWRSSGIGAALMLVALTITAVGYGQLSPVVSTIFLGWSAAAVLLGEALRSRRNYLTGLAERSRFAQRSREDEFARRIAEERLRIARDLHDSVAHAMTTINVQAGAAAHVLPRRPEAAGQALGVIQQASAQVLDELASMLNVLRQETSAAERAPAPGLADIRQLAQAVGPSGLAVDLRSDGELVNIPPAVSTAGYRVVQESLTNAMRHSHAGRASVQVTAPPTGPLILILQIRDPGPARVHEPGGQSPGSGVGIQGMRERVTATGGRFSAGPTPDGGYLVRADWGAAG